MEPNFSSSEEQEEEEEEKKEEQNRPKKAKRPEKMLVSECLDCSYPFRYPKSGGVRRKLCDACSTVAQLRVDDQRRREEELRRSWHPSNWLQASLPHDSYLRLVPAALFFELMRPGGFWENAGFQDQRRKGRELERIEKQLEPELLLPRGAVAIRRLGRHAVRPAPRPPDKLWLMAAEEEEEEWV